MPHLLTRDLSFLHMQQQKLPPMHTEMSVCIQPFNLQQTCSLVSIDDGTHFLSSEEFVLLFFLFCFLS